MATTKESEQLHPIQVVVRRSGVSADLLRAWEKRYQVVQPSRSTGRRRLYSAADVERLRLIKEALAGGRRIGDVAALPTADIQRMVAEDVAGRQPRPVGQSADDPEPLLAEAIEAVRRADQRALRAILSRALLARSPGRFIVDVATPFLHRLGDLWVRGELSPAHEHAGSEVVLQLMHELLGKLTPPDGAPRLVVATPSGQHHEIGALFAAAAAALDGWSVTYLGSDLPARDIGRVALSLEATAIALSITTDGPGLSAELGALRRSVGRRLPILVGGQQAAAIAVAARGVDAVADVAAFTAALRDLAAARAGAAGGIT